MSASRHRSPLYKLIAAGQLVHRAVLAPVLSLGLEAGDDALLYLVARSKGISEADLAAKTGLEHGTLRHHLERLIDRDLVVRRANGAHMLPRLYLTPRGARLEAALAGHWQELEHALLGSLRAKQRKRFGKRLSHIVALLKD